MAVNLISCTSPHRCCLRVIDPVQFSENILILGVSENKIFLGDSAAYAKLSTGTSCAVGKRSLLAVKLWSNGTLRVRKH